MGVNKSKLKCLCLPAQSGKTRKVEEKIRFFSALSNLFGNPGIINIFISANNKLLVHQTTSRFSSSLGSSSDDEAESNACIKGSIFSWTSGTKKTNISPKELAFEMLGGVDMVVLCAHGTRMRYLNQMLGHLTAHPAFHKEIYIWIDEADKTVNTWSKYPDLINNPAVQQVTLISATVESLGKRYGRISVLPYTDTYPACYRRLKDSVTIIEDIVRADAVDYIRAVLKKHKAKLIQPGMRAFIPGDYTKQSHEDVSELLIRRGFAVIILNGDSKELRIPDKKPIDLRPYLTSSDPDDIPDEFNAILSTMYVDNELHNYPLAITGFLCVSRGVTFQCAPEPGVHNGFLFEYGIIPPIIDKAEAYQTMARLFGNIGDFPDYKSCEIYTNDVTFKRVQNQEEIAVNLAKIVAEQNLDEVGMEHFAQAAMTPEEFANRQTEELRKDVPIVIGLDKETMENILLKSPEKKARALRRHLAKSHPELAETLRAYKVKKIICPDSAYSKKRHIDQNITAAINEKRVTMNIKPVEQEINNWQCFLDKDGERAIYLAYHGERKYTPRQAASPPRPPMPVNPFGEDPIASTAITNNPFDEVIPGISSTETTSTNPFDSF